MPNLRLHGVIENLHFLETNERYSKKAEEIFGRIESGELQGVIANLVR